MEFPCVFQTLLFCSNYMQLDIKGTLVGRVDAGICLPRCVWPVGTFAACCVSPPVLSAAFIPLGRRSGEKDQNYALWEPFWIPIQGCGEIPKCCRNGKDYVAKALESGLNRAGFQLMRYWPSSDTKGNHGLVLCAHVTVQREPQDYSLPTSLPPGKDLKLLWKNLTPKVNQDNAQRLHNTMESTILGKMLWLSVHFQLAVLNTLPTSSTWLLWHGHLIHMQVLSFRLSVWERG